MNSSQKANLRAIKSYFTSIQNNYTFSSYHVSPLTSQQPTALLMFPEAQSNTAWGEKRSRGLHSLHSKQLAVVEEELTRDEMAFLRLCER
jgi:hypothetical protein